METVTTFPRSPVEPIRPTGASPTAAADRLITVIAIYELTEDGRKASLLTGGDGRAIQQVTLQVPAGRLHLVTVDADGVARLKLRPRYQLDTLQRVVRIDAPPSYDAPPILDDLLKEAARNHQLERAHDAERIATRTKRREASRELRNKIAQQFLSDRSQRALRYPVPTPEQCSVAGPEGRLRFDVTSDDGPAQQVPPEAHRRFRADLRDRAEQKRQAHAAQLSVHEEKKRVAAEWIAVHGSPEQQARQAAGVLPVSEVVELITAEMLRPLDAWPIYPLDGAERLQARVRQDPQYDRVTITLQDLAITVKDSPTATEAQWTLVQALQQALPDAAVTLRAHRLAWKKEPRAPTLTVFGARVKYKHGPFTLCREYAAPDAD